MNTNQKADDTLFEPFKQAIQVLSPRQKGMSMLLSIALLMILLLLLFSCQPESETDRSQSQVLSNVHFSDELKRNLHQLKVLQEQVIHDSPLNKHADSSQLLREHAPTQIYQVTVSNKSQQNLNDMISHPNQLQHTVLAGEIIDAVLETAIDSSIAGLTRAMVTRPVYAAQGRRLLIPTGTRVLGEYNNQIIAGQRRLGIMWHELILPTGRHVHLESPSTDKLGRTGQAADVVEHHFWEQFGQASLLSLIGASISPHTSVTDANAGVTESPYRAGIANAFQDNAVSQVEKPVQGPTIRVQQGAAIDLIVNRDLLL